MSELFTRLLDAVFAEEESARILVETHPESLEARSTHVGETALHWLAIENHLDQVRALAALGANVNGADFSGDTPLMSAAKIGHREMAELLIELGADVNHCNNMKEGALHSAARGLEPEICRLLLDAGARVDARDDGGSTPLHFLLHQVVYEPSAGGLQFLDILPPELQMDLRQRPEMLERIENYREERTDPARLVAVARVLLEGGADPNAETDFGERLVHYACAAADRYPQPLELLLEGDCELHTQDCHEKTPADHLKGQARERFRVAFARRGIWFRP